MAGRVLITGRNGYIGRHVGEVLESQGGYSVDRISLRGEDWRGMDLGVYDAILHLAGISHADAQALSREEQQTYYSVNRDLSLELAQKAAGQGVGYFVYASSAIVYGRPGGRGAAEVDAATPPQPESHYGRSKLEAEEALTGVEGLRLAILRLPMVYGAGCKGNFPLLASLARKLPIFPDYPNRRSFLYIENLSAYILYILEHQPEGLHWPWNGQAISTARMVQALARSQGRRIYLSAWLNPLVDLGMALPGRAGGIFRKAFGTLAYAEELDVLPFDGQRPPYRLYGLEESLERMGGRAEDGGR